MWQNELVIIVVMRIRWINLIIKLNRRQNLPGQFAGTDQLQSRIHRVLSPADSTAFEI